MAPFVKQFRKEVLVKILLKNNLHSHQTDENIQILFEEGIFCKSNNLKALREAFKKKNRIFHDIVQKGG